MSEETAPTTEQAPAQAPAEEAPQTPEQPADNLPEWAREKLTKANNEAARYRHEAKEASTKAREEAKAEFEAQLKELSDAKAAIAAELEQTRVEALKYNAAISVGVPGESAAEFASLLKGETHEEVVAHAEKVKELLGSSQQKSDRAVDPTQGAGGPVQEEATPGIGRLMNAYKA